MKKESYKQVQLTPIQGEIGVANFATVNVIDDAVGKIKKDIEAIDEKVDSNTDEFNSLFNTLKQRQRKAERAQKKFDDAIKKEIDSNAYEAGKHFGLLASDIDQIKYELSDVKQDLANTILELHNLSKSFMVLSIVFGIAAMVVAYFIIFK